MCLARFYVSGITNKTSISRPDVPDEPLLRRRLPDVRLRGDRVHEQRRGEPRGSDDTNLSADDQVHVPQVRRVRRLGTARLPVHIATERGEREDLRVPVVLVHHTGRADVFHGDLPHRDNILAANESVLAEDEVQTGQEGCDRSVGETEQDG